MRSLNICIDIDGTVTEPYYWLRRVNQYFHTCVQPEDVTVYEIHKILGIEEEEYSQFYRVFGKLLHMEAKIRFGAREVINKLYHNHYIHFVSAREEIMRDVSLQWFDEHQIPMDSITLLGNSDKVNRANELRSDIFIEDKYENAIQLSNAGFFVLLIDCNYNKGTLPSNVMRINTWAEIENYIENMSHSYDEFELTMQMI